MTTFSSVAVFAELWYSMQMIKLAVGVTPTCWRPPYGDVDDRVRAIAHGLGLQTIMWEYDTEDADVGGSGSDAVTDQDVITNYQAFIQTASNGTFSNTGAIVLTHELNNFTMSEAVNFYPQLKAAFQHIVPVGVSLNKTQPYVETNYSLPTFEEYISGQVIANGTRISPTNTTSSASSTATESAASSDSGNGEAASSSNGAKNLGYDTLLLPVFLGMIYSLF